MFVIQTISKLFLIAGELVIMCCFQIFSRLCMNEEVLDGFTDQSKEHMV